jgi:PAN domain-containing protein
MSLLSSVLVYMILKLVPGIVTTMSGPKTRTDTFLRLNQPRPMTGPPNQQMKRAYCNWGHRPKPNRVWPAVIAPGRAVMPHLRAVLVTATISITLIVAPPASAGYSLFVFVQQADSPGNDYSRINNSSFDECEHSCETDTACNAFTYNQIKGVCFLKSAAAQWTTITLGAITGIKLSPLLPSELSPPSEGK